MDSLIENKSSCSPLRGVPLILLIVILAAGLGLRAWTASHNGFPTVDGVLYLDQTDQMVNNGHLPWSCFPPGWPALVAAPYSFLNHEAPLSLLRAAQIANVLFGTLMPLLAFIFMRPFLGTRLSIAGMAVLMFLPLNIVYSKNDLSEMSFTCALLAGWLLWRNKKWVLTGLVFGLAYLIRPEALLAAGGLGLAAWRRDRIFPWRMALAMIVTMIPYLIFIRLQTGVFDLSSKSVAVSLSLEAYPGWSYLGLIVKNLGVFLPKLSGVLGLPLVALSLWGAIKKPGPWLWLFAPLLPVPFIINPMDVRFWVPYLPLFVFAAGLGLMQLSELAARWQKIGLVVAVLVGLGFAAQDEVYWIKRNSEAFYGLKDAGEWLSTQTTSDTVIASYKPYTSFWAGTRFIKYPAGMDAAELVIWARNNGAEYMIVNVKVVHTLAPELDPFLSQPLRADLAQRVTLVKFFEYDLVEHNTVVYRLNK